MSRIPLAKYDQAVISGQVATVPPGWGRLFAPELERSHETIPGFDRTRYQVIGTERPVNGEVWACQSNGPTPARKVTAGYLQVFVMSGSLSVTKNGSVLYVKASEKVTFQPGDIFSLNGSSGTTMVVRNESSTLAPAAHPQTTTQSVAISQQVVNTVRAQLGLLDIAPPQRPFRHDEERSSAAWRGRPKY